MTFRLSPLVQRTRSRFSFHFGRHRPRAADNRRQPDMPRIGFSLLVAMLLVSCSSPRPVTGIPTETQIAMRQLHVGMTEDAALAIMKPVALDSGRRHLGGTGSGFLYFQVSDAQQFCLEIAAAQSLELHASEI